MTFCLFVSEYILQFTLHYDDLEAVHDTLDGIELYRDS